MIFEDSGLYDGDISIALIENSKNKYGLDMAVNLIAKCVILGSGEMNFGYFGVFGMLGGVLRG